jgi:hypothetical protein
MKRRLLASLAILGPLTGCGPPDPERIAQAIAFLPAARGDTLAVLRPGGTAAIIARDGRELRAGALEGVVSLIARGAAEAPDDAYLAFALRHGGPLPGFAIEGLAANDESFRIGSPPPGDAPIVRYEPRVDGTKTGGRIDSETLAVAGFDAAGHLAVLLRVDLVAREVVPWPGVELAGARLASVSPDASFVALVLEAEGRAAELRVVDAAGREVARVPNVALAAPNWLRGYPALLFSRPEIGIYRLPLRGDEPEWLCDGELFADPRRAEVAERYGDEGFVSFERPDLAGIVQVTRAAPFALAGERVRQLTSSEPDHYGHAWSADRRFLTYRQASRAARAGGGKERLVVIDRDAGHRASGLVERSVASRYELAGPTFAATGHDLFYLADGAVYRVSGLAD